MANMTRKRRIVIFAVVLAVASAAIGAMVLASRPMSSDMPGMDMSGTQMPQSSPTPTTKSADMPGMDMPATDMPKSPPTPTTKSGEMPGMDMPGSSKTTELAQDRPLAPVLGTFGGGTAVVLLTAGMLRRKDRAASQAKEAARAARRTQK